MKAPVTVGDLRHRIVIEAETRVSDGAGGASATWQTVAEVWAAIWPRSTDETFTADRLAGRATHDIWIRHRAGVVPAMRLRFGQRLFDIRGVIDSEDRGHWLKCVVEERDL
ncbi:MAG: phage head closure protein [Hyphomicrobium sp.]